MLFVVDTAAWILLQRIRYFRNDLFAKFGLVLVHLFLIVGFFPIKIDANALFTQPTSASPSNQNSTTNKAKTKTKTQ